MVKFAFDDRDNGKKELVLEGRCYLDDSDKEFESVNKFLDNLKTSPGFNKYFNPISIVSLDHAQVGKVAVTTFVISCKTNNEGK